MAQWLSSFYFYVVDLLRRCFAESYLVKAEGNSPIEHDFRRCWKCGNFITSLSVQCEEQRCRKCKTILHKNGKYLFVKKVFILRRSLHSKLFALTQLFFLLYVVAGLSVFRIKSIPEGYDYPDLHTLLWLVFILGLWMLAWPLFAKIKIFSDLFKRDNFVAEILKTIIIFSIIIVMLFLLELGIDTPFKKAAIPFWTRIPSQEQIYQQQYEELKNMPLDVKRFSFALTIAKNPLVNLQKEYSQIAENDFAGMMKDQRNNLNRFAPKGSQKLQEFYGYYRSHLATLNEDALKEQCEHDPWNLATNESLRLYSETWDRCQQK